MMMTNRSVLALTVVAAGCQPAHVLLTVEDPQRQATDAVVIAIGADLGDLVVRKIDHDLPARFALVKGKRSAEPLVLWAEARDADGASLALGFTTVVFPGSGSADALIRLGAICERNNTTRLPCANRDRGIAGICANGVCSDPESVSFCLDAQDCINPGDCQELPATCTSGVCDYTPHAAGTPCDDGSVCTLSDICNVAGACVGDPVVCGDTAGGCKQSTGCDRVGGCLYVDTVDSTLCIRGQELGYCVAGVCEQCTMAQHCPDLGNIPCVDKQCVANECTYIPNDGLECEAAVCIAGARIAPRICSATFCVSQGGTDCGGFICDPAITDCLTSCVAVNDCLPGLTCGPSGCEGLKSNGVACEANGECINTCIDALCAADPVLGGNCDDTSDCPAGQDCFDCSGQGACTSLPSSTVGQCRKTFGSSCAANTECPGACISSNCLPIAAIGDACDAGDDADCVSPAICSASGNICLLPLGSACSSVEQCESGLCEGGVCCSEQCGVCSDCAASGNCTLTPLDDPDCGTLDCTVLDQPCLIYGVIENRCAGFGVCKSLADCQSLFLPSGAVCRPAGTCDSTQDVCNGSTSDCPDSYALTWSSPARCEDVIDQVAVANNRRNLISQDFVDCLAFCDGLQNVVTCSLLGTSIMQFDFVLCDACSSSAVSADSQGVFTVMLTALCE